MITTFTLEIYLLLVIAGIVIMIQTGRRLGIRRGPGTSGGTGAIQASIFGLMGLLLAFTFYGAGARFDARRNHIIEEANAISTAYRLLDLLPQQAQPHLKELFREYVLLRAGTYQKIADTEGFKVAIARTSDLQNQIWQEAFAAAATTGTTAAQIVLLPSLNQMFSLETTRTATLEFHSPYSVIILLALTVLVSSFLAGYELSFGGQRSWLYGASYIIVVCLALAVIADYEYPRLGLINLSSFDKFISQALEEIK